jgi:glutamate racemase
VLSVANAAKAVLRPAVFSRSKQLVGKIQQRGVHLSSSDYISRVPQKERQVELPSSSKDAVEGKVHEINVDSRSPGIDVHSYTKSMAQTITRSVSPRTSPAQLSLGKFPTVKAKVPDAEPSPKHENVALESPAHLYFFDSGIGGLAGVKATREAGIRSDITYIGDSINNPYGTKTADQLDLLGKKWMMHAASLNVDFVVPVCHTWETKAINYLHLLPPSTQYISLIEAGAKGAASEKGVKKIATVSTNATAESHAYRDAIKHADPSKEVVEVKGQNLTKLIEKHAKGELLDRLPLLEEAKRVLSKVPEDTDLIIHGSTHYPFVDKEFAEILPARVLRVSSVDYQAQEIKKALAERASIGDNNTRFFTTGNAEEFKTQVTNLLGITNPDVMPFVDSEINMPEHTQVDE